MKKQFFYAALAIGMMSSCSSNDLPGNQAPEEQLPEEERVAMELGIQAPASSITASTRSTGAVGGTTNETNLWKGQKLYVLAYEKGTTDKVIDSETITEENPDGDYIFEGLSFEAPAQTWNSGTSLVEGGNTIKIMKDASTIQYVYYNPTGNMDFFGYHIDQDVDERTTGVVNGYTVENLTITGAEDLLGARTKKVDVATYPGAQEADINAFNAETPARGFSAWAARRRIQPILDFQHLLTRFTFTVEAAEQSAAEWYHNGSEWKPNLSTETPAQSTAVKIKSITIKGIETNVDIVLYEDGKDKPYVKVRSGSPLEDLALKGRNVSGESSDFNPTAAMVYNDASHNAETNKGTFSGGNYSTQTPIGESLMIPAGSNQITLHIELEQRVIDTENTETAEKTYKVKTGTVDKILNYSEVQDSEVTSDVFAAGASYAVNIRVFSFQRIEITASLSKWENGGNLGFDAE